MIKRFLILILLFSVVSCNFHIEKRRYFKGYHVEIQKASNNLAKKSETPTIEDNSSALAIQENIKFIESNSSLSENSYTANEQNHALELVSFTSASEARNNKAKTNSLKKTTFTTKESKTKSISKKKKSDNDGYLFSLFALIGLSMLALLQKFKFSILKISNWAARNKYKTQVIIGVLQIAYISLGIALGKELHHFGYTFSNASYYAFAGLFTLGILAYFLQKISKKIDVLKSFFRKKLFFLSITLASIMMAIGIGNKAGEGNTTKSVLGWIVERHQNESDFKQSNATATKYSFVEQHVSSPDNTDAALMGLYIFLIVLTAILTVIMACVVLCMAALGVAEPASLAYAIIALVICIAGLALSIVALARLRQKMKKEGNDPKSDSNPTF